MYYCPLEDADCEGECGLLEERGGCEQCIDDYGTLEEFDNLYGAEREEAE